ncbi:hypothetical protein ZWY2020_033601 [Hordeum vulgare]|nr:hypothetical protein ZWY2020_033601 [Hordeum vulgare]
MIKEMNRSHDDDFVRTWLDLVFSCFLAPSTSISISPRRFPAVMDVNVITETNICQFVVDQLKLAFTLGRHNKKVVCCCVFHLVLLYLDLLDVDEPIPNLVPRVLVWNSDLIAKVIKTDRKARENMIMFPVLENIDKTDPVTRNHYWIFNVNIRD